MTVMRTVGSRRGSTMEVDGFLLTSLNLKIKAEPSFFCPLTGKGSRREILCTRALPIPWFCGLS